jgi:hypothetical protein
MYEIIVIDELQGSSKENVKTITNAPELPKSAQRFELSGILSMQASSRNSILKKVSTNKNKTISQKTVKFSRIVAIKRI